MSDLRGGKGALRAGLTGIETVIPRLRASPGRGRTGYSFLSAALMMSIVGFP